MNRHFYLLMLLIALSSCGKKSGYENPCKELDAVDLEMLNIHKQIQKEYADDPLFLQKLQDAQVYWIQYKNRHIRSLYPKDSKFYKKNYDKQYNYCKCAEAARLTVLRVKEMKLWLDGKHSGNDCPSSIR